MHRLSTGLPLTALYGLLVACQTPFLFADDSAAEDAKAAAAKFQPLTISKEVTVITEPVTKDGRIDYIEHVNKVLSAGVTPANNAAVPFVQALGTEYLGQNEGYKRDFFQRLGIEPPAAGSKFFREFVPAEAKADEDRWAQFNAAMERPWTAQQFPELANWLQQNTDPLKQIAQGLERPKWYLPLAFDPDEEESKLMLAILLPTLQESRSVGRALVMRANLNIGEKRYATAQQDLLACHRLARHLGKGPTIIDALVSIAIDWMTSTGDANLIAAPGVPAKLYRNYQAQLVKLPALPSMARCVDQFERLAFLDSLQVLARRPAAEELGLIDGGGAVAKMVMMAGPALIDWDSIALKGNAYYDKMVAAMQHPTHSRRVQAMHKLTAELKEIAKPPTGKDIALKTLFGGSLRKQMSEQIGNILMALLLPAVEQAREAETRAQAREAATQVGLLLAAWQAEHGEYPASLEELASKSAKSLPEDPYLDKPLTYRVTGNGFKLYSLGKNLKDDGGISLDQAEFYDASDIVVQVPLPKPRID